MIVLRPDDPAGDLEVNKDAYAVIGSITIRWARFERQLVNSIHLIERAECLARGVVLGLTPITAPELRDFTAKKGHLRGLVERLGKRAALSALDRIFHDLVNAEGIRHHLAHGVTSMTIPKANHPPMIAMTSLGPPNSRKPTDRVWKSVAELAAVSAELVRLRLQLEDIRRDVIRTIEAGKP